MGDTSKKMKVDFPAYCEAFSVIERWKGEVCGALDPGGSEHSVETMYRQDPGDGYVRVPSYKVVLGKFDASGSVWLKDDGSVFSDDGAGNTQGLSGVDAEKAAYFMAGAFGVGEVTSGMRLDGSIVSGINKLYKQCLKSIDTCLEGPDAKVLSARWSVLQNSRQELESKKNQVAALWREFDELAPKVQGVLAMQTTMIGNSLSRNPVTMEDCQSAEKGLAQLIAAIKGGIAQVERQASADQMRREIEGLNSRTAALTSQVISEQHVGMTRFQDAVAAGMSCMPVGVSKDEELCVARNKYSMVSEILSRAVAWPDRTYCAESRSYTHTSSGSRGEGDGIEHTDSVCIDLREYGYDYDADALQALAQGYCSMTCR